MGMILMTDGLKALAGDSLRRIIGRCASGPVSSVAAGTTLTVLVQSSHATTLATIGFVSSGLLTFQQSLGVIVGANLGTTSTGWLVALLGFKLNIASIAFLFVGVGALMRLLGRDWVASAGVTCAGFGLIFVGIDTLQGGMSELAQRMTPGDLPSGTIVGRLLLVIFGFLMTVIMQSSSAAIATTLTALHAGTVSFDQAAALVIGQNVGSSVTAAVAAFGASVPAKRTALAHILFNVITAVVAFAILPLFVEFVNFLADTWARGNEAIALAAFHTLFKLLGVSIFMPLLSTFAVMLTRIVPDRGPVLTRHLDATVGREPQAAVEAAHVTLVSVLAEQARMARNLLQMTPQRDFEPIAAATHEALARTSDFLAGISGTYKSDGIQRRRLGVAHALDHQRSLAETLQETQHADIIREVPSLRTDAQELAAALEEVLRVAHTSDESKVAESLGDLSQRLAATRRARREQVLAETASGRITPEVALRELDAIRWIDRLGYHVWRSAAHLFNGNGKEVHHPEE
jgi:phosphate:Na+ symporter